MAITVTCPSCSTSFPVDPAKIPEGGVNARCSSCGDIFRVEKPVEAEPLPTLEDLTPTEPAAPPQAAPADAPAVPETSQPEPTASQPEATPEPAQTPEIPAAPPLAEPPSMPEEPAVAEPVGEAPAPSAPDDGGDDPFAQPAPFEVSPPQAEAAPAAPEETLPSPEPEAPLPPVEPAEPLPAPESHDQTPPSPQPPAPEPGEPEPAEAVAETSAPAVQGFTFGKRDPTDKAKRLARVLVSDMIMYNAERHQTALAQGTLQQDFEEEIEKSWKEFVEQVGEELANAEGRTFWKDALNDILAKGEEIF
ncbi:MAG: zinc-ribbon domain-containing protein [Longimicrobiales bacterium]|nr:zinc-ribbon domain-containing protein [Longimicrobiales bacterium]